MKWTSQEAYLQIPAEGCVGPIILMHFHSLHVIQLIGLISTPVNVKVSGWSSGLSQALEAKEKLLNIINERLQTVDEG